MRAYYYITRSIALILILLAIFSLPAQMPGGQPSAQSANLKIVGANGDANPVVNEANQIKVSVVDANGMPVSGVTFETDSPDIATIDSSGNVTGVQQGYATITARTPKGDTSN